MIDAYSFVGKLGLRNKISTCMEVCVFELVKVLKNNLVVKIMKNSNEKRFSSKGKGIIDINNRIVEEAVSHMREINVDKSWINLVYIEEDGKYLLKKHAFVASENDIEIDKALAEKLELVDYDVVEARVECELFKIITVNGNRKNYKFRRHNRFVLLCLLFYVILRV